MIAVARTAVITRPIIEGSLARKTAPVLERRRAQRYRLKPTVAIAVGAILAVSLILSYLGQYAAATRLGYQNQQLEQKLSMLKQEQGELALMVAQLSSLERIEAEARRMGMVEAEQTHIVVPGITK